MKRIGVACDIKQLKALSGRPHKKFLSEIDFVYQHQVAYQKHKDIIHRMIIDFDYAELASDGIKDIFNYSKRKQLLTAIASNYSKKD